MSCTPHPGPGKSARPLLLAWLCLSLLAALRAAAPGAKVFDLPAGEAAQTLRSFSRQSGEEILFPPDEVRGVRTRPVTGRCTAGEALATMLAGTGLEAVPDPASGAYVIKRASAAGAPAPPTVAHPLSDARAAANAPNREPVVLTPFEVRSRSDQGYRAANTISATRMAVPIGELPMNVTTFTADFIADQKAYDLYDIVKWASGVHQDNASPQGWIRYNIRGFTRAAVQRDGFESFRFVDTTNIERIEVVKGPASLLYGQINPGGVINAITKRPEPKPQLSVAAAGGTNDYARLMVDSTGPLSSQQDNLLYRLVTMAENVQQFQVFAHGRKYLIAPSLTWKSPGDVALTVAYERFARHDDMPTSGLILRYTNSVPGLPYGPLPWDFSYASRGDYQDFVSDALTAELTAKLGSQIDFRATYADLSWNMEWRATGQGGTGLIAQSAIDAYYPPGAGLTPANAMFRRNRWEHQWGRQRSLLSDATAHLELPLVKLRMLVGVKQIFDNPYRGVQRNNPNVPGNPSYLRPWDLRDPNTWDRAVPFGVEALAPTVDTANASAATAYYGVLSAAMLADRLHLLAGYAHHRVNNDPTLNRLAGTATPPTERSAGIPQYGAIFDVAAGISFFASYSESFLANTNMLRVNNVPTSPAAPSVGHGAEAGVKLALFGGRLTGTASCYRIRANPTDIITVTTGLAPDGTTLFTDLQGGSQLSQGLEFDLLLTPADGLQMMVAFGQADATYEKHPAKPEFDGSPLVATPDRTLSVWGKYAPHNGPLAGFSLAGGLNYVGSMTFVGNNPYVRFSPYTTVDLALGYRLRLAGRAYDLEVSVKNVLNEHYYASASSWGFPRHAIFSLSTKL